MFRDFNSPVSAWRNSEQRYTLNGMCCVVCNLAYYAKQYVCECGSSQFEAVVFSGKGTVLSFTEVHIPSIEFHNLDPYILALVQLVEGPRLLAQITDVALADMFIGAPVESVFRRYFSDGDGGLIYYGIKFILVR